MCKWTLGFILGLFLAFSYVSAQDIVISNGPVTATFSKDFGLAIIDLRYGDSENLINSTKERGREYQSALWEGYPQDMPPANLSWVQFWNVINPTQAGMAYPTPTGSRVISYNVSGQTLTASIDALDYTTSFSKGGYRLNTLAGRWPRTGWYVDVTYRVDSDGVYLKSVWHHADTNSRYVDFVDNIAHLEPMFSGPFVNDEERDTSSWCRENFFGDHITIDDKVDGVRATMVGYGNTELHGRISDLDKDGGYDNTSPGCPQRVNPPILHPFATDLVSLTARTNVYRMVAKNTLITTESKLFLSKIPKEPQYVIPLATTFGYSSSIYALSVTGDQCYLSYFKDGENIGNKVLIPVVVDKLNPLVIEVSNDATVGVLTCEKSLDKVFGLWYTPSGITSVIDVGKK